MPNNEDYLDSLLSDITKVRTDSKKADDDAARERKKKIANRNRISPREDFLEANGLDHYQPKPVRHNNLRRALSESDFLKDFEAELDEDGADSFLREFERKLVREEKGREEEKDDSDEEFERIFSAASRKHTEEEEDDSLDIDAGDKEDSSLDIDAGEEEDDSLDIDSGDK